MKKTNFTVSYDDEKLSTIKLYMEQKGLSLEDEICKAVDTLYGKYVPQNVRDFLELKNGLQKTAVPKAKKPKAAPVALPEEANRGDGT